MKTRGEGGQQCIFNAFLTEPVEDNEHLGRGSREATGGGLNPQPPTNRTLCVRVQRAEPTAFV